MSQSTISLRVDSEDKAQFEEFCNSTGMNISVAVNMFIKAVLRDRRLPFDVTDIPRTETAQAIKDVREGKNLHGPFDSVRELMEDLYAED